MSTYSKVTTFVLSFLLVSSCFLTAFATSPDLYRPSKVTDEKIVLHNRKFLMGLIGKVEEEKPKYGAEMRGVPAGPDPLHHNNSPQNRPIISP